MASFVKIEGKLLKGVFQERLNRFLALVRVNSRILPSFVPNPGRMLELLTPNIEVVLREVRSKGNRKTGYDLIGVIYNDNIVSIDSRVPNKLIFEALKNKEIKEFLEYRFIKPEYNYERTRFDFFLANEKERCLLEVKSCTLVKEGVALFPDAPTKRGQKHVRNLIKAKNNGYRTSILFVVQRNEPHYFSPNDEIDPDFGKILRYAALKGVEVYAYRSIFLQNKILLDEPIKVEL